MLKKILPLLMTAITILSMSGAVFAENQNPKSGNSTDAFNASINLAGENDKFYGGEIITIYNNVSISGNSTQLDEGGYTVITIPKSEFSKPAEKDVSTEFDNFNGLKIEETADAYRIITSYKTLYGGYDGGTPVRLNLLQRQTVNKSSHVIKQQLFDKDGNPLTKESTLKIEGKAKIETLNSRSFGTDRLKTEVDDKFVIKNGTYREFAVGYNTPNYNENDPRDRRIYAIIPDGTKVKPSTGWTKEEITGRYYKDVKRTDLPSSLKIELDLGGIDLSSHDAKNKAKEFKVTFTTQPVVDGVVKDDLGPYTATSTRNYYILKQEPAPVDPAAYQTGSTYVYNKTINADYQPVSGGTRPAGSWHMSGGYYGDRNLTYLSYNKELLNSQRIRYTHQIITSYSVNNSKKDDEMRTLQIPSSDVTVSSYTAPKELRLMIIGLNDADAETLRTMLKGTKAYGVKADGTKVLLSDDIPMVAYGKYADSHTKNGWEKFAGGEEYKKIEFVYPETLKMVGKTQINKFAKAIWPDIVADIKEDAYTTLKGKLDDGSGPVISYTPDYAYTSLIGEFIKTTGGTAEKVTGKWSDSTRDEFRMQYETIERANSINITNGSQFFTNDTITTRLGYNQYRYGNFAASTEPTNANIYYLVPDGLEPVDDENMFSDIQVIRGYKDGYNLVVAKPKTTAIPGASEAINTSKQNNYQLSFTATQRLDVGTYKIYSCLSIDNNKIGVDKEGNQYGILQMDKPSDVWSTIQNDAKNRADDRTHFTDFRSASFTLYPPKVLSSVKQVKMTSEPDSKYASSLGSKATIGDKIDYRWKFKNNSNKDITRLSIIDVLPHRGDTSVAPNGSGFYPERGSKYSTPLLSVEENELFDFYYSTDPVQATVAANNAANWTTSVDDMSKVTMIKAVLKDGKKIPMNDTATVVTHNQIENNDKIEDGETAHNSFALSMNEGASWEEALDVEVQVTYPKRDVQIQKTDLNDSTKKLYNAVFSLYEEGTGADGGDRLLKENITTNHDGVATIADLLVGKEYYLLETKAPDGYAKSPEKIKFKVTPAEQDGAAQILKVTNDIPRTSVSVTKKWNGPATDEVTVHLMNGDKEVDTMKLTADKQWKGTFTNLPVKDSAGKKISYTVKEEPVDEYESEVRGDAENGFTITNTAFGDLEISKKVTGNAANKDKSFQFKVRLDNKTVSGTHGDLTFDKGEATFTLKDGETKKAEHLPNGMKYTVTEENYSADGYVTAKTGDTGNIKGKETVKAEFTNTRNTFGNLKISKEVKGSGGDKNKKFDFTVTLDDKTVTGTYGNLEFKEGVATFRLKDGESVEGKDLPNGVGYAVIEADYSKDGYTTEKEGDTGKIKGNDTTEVSFRNTRNKGIISGTQEKKNSPFTGDNGHVELWLAVMVIALTALAGRLIYEHRRHADEDVNER